MKTLTAKETNEEVGRAIDAAQRIGFELNFLRISFANGTITAADFKKKLETLHRHNANELVAMIANLSYEVA